MGKLLDGFYLVEAQEKARYIGEVNMENIFYHSFPLVAV
jgi:hypothetical protein